jgi:hypothetical protein
MCMEYFPWEIMSRFIPRIGHSLDSLDSTVDLAFSNRPELIWAATGLGEGTAAKGSTGVVPSDAQRRFHPMAPKRFYVSNSREWIHATNKPNKNLERHVHLPAAGVIDMPTREAWRPIFQYRDQTAVPNQRTDVGFE